MPAFTNTIISWDTTTEDTDNAHSETVNPDRIYVPAWAKYCVITAQGQILTPTASGMYDVYIEKTTGGTPVTEFVGNIEVIYAAIAANTFSFTVSSGKMRVIPGDYFRLGLFNLSAGTATLGVPNTNFFNAEFSS